MTEKISAGWSAFERAKKQRERSEWLARSAANWEKGAKGEAATASALSQLPATEWTIFHDLRWPGRTYANVDHIAVGPSGVFVIDSKNWSGELRLDGGVLRQNGRSRDAKVAAAAEASRAVAQLLPSLPLQLVQPVLCFCRDDDQPTGWARDVMVCTTRSLVPAVASRPPALSAEQRQMICLELDASLRGMSEPTPYAGWRPPESPAAPVPPALPESAALPESPAVPLVPAPPAPPAVPLPPVVPTRPRIAEGAEARSTRKRRRAQRDGAAGVVLLVLGAVLLCVPAARDQLGDLISSLVPESSLPAGGAPDAQGDCPDAAPIKGIANANGRRVRFAPGSKRYEAVRATRCFADVTEAKAAGFRRPGR